MFMVSKKYGQREYTSYLKDGKWLAVVKAFKYWILGDKYIKWVNSHYKGPQVQCLGIWYTWGTTELFLTTEWHKLSSVSGLAWQQCAVHFGIRRLDYYTHLLLAFSIL